MLTPVNCKDKEDPFKIEGAISPIVSLWIFFLDAQGQLTPLSVFGFGQNLIFVQTL